MAKSDLLNFIAVDGTSHTLLPARMLTPEQWDRILHLYVVLATHVTRPDRDTNIQSMQLAAAALNEILQTLLPAVAPDELTTLDPTLKVQLIVQWRAAQPMAKRRTPLII